MISAWEALLADLYTGRLTRRAFCKRAIALGLSASTAAAALAACDAFGSSPPSTHSAQQGTSTIAWEREQDYHDTFKYLAEKFTSFTPSIKVQQKQGPSIPVNGGSKALAMHDDLFNKLRAGQKTPDIVSLDVVWVSEFANNNWLVPLDDRWSRWSAQDPLHFLTVPLEAVKYPDTPKGHIWAAPLHTDVGILYYRTDIFDTPPKTWQELYTMSEYAMTNKKIRWGYVWQGASYEGLICDFIEVLSSYGGRIFDVSDPKVVIINSDAALKALTEMVNWIGTISPPGVVNYQETDAGDTWRNGDAAFMRNWPNYIALSNDASQSKVAGKFDIASLPAGTKSCIGGWQMAINRFSPNKDAAWEFIKWMLQPDAQQYLAIKEGFPVTLESVYANTYFKQSDSPYYNPFFSKLEPILKNAQFRPVSPHYPDIAKAIEKHIYSALLKQKTPKTALQDLQGDLEIIISSID